jgi:hypothetical protein
MENLTGGCLCGRVRYEVGGELRGLVYCHCKRCQRRTGTAFSVAAVVGGPRAVTVTEGADQLRTYEPEEGFHKQFCDHCGSQLFTVDDGEIRFVRAGTLDESPEVPVLWHQFVAYKVPWHPLPEDGAPRFPERMRRD